MYDFGFWSYYLLNLVIGEEIKYEIVVMRMFFVFFNILIGLSL